MRKFFRIIRIILTTFSMYVITHLFVFVTLPIAILVSFIDKECLPSLKCWFVKSLFAIVGKKLKVTGFENVVPDHAYVIISNYPSFYAGFSLMCAFPRASVVARAFLKKIPILGAILSRAGAVFVQSGKGRAWKKCHRSPYQQAG